MAVPADRDPEPVRSFRSDNRFQPVIEALGIIQRNLATRRAYFSERVPIEGVVTSSWKEKVFEQVNGKTKTIVGMVAAQYRAEPIATGRKPECVTDFWEAEPEHQDYLQRYPDGYTCHFVRAPLETADSHRQDCKAGVTADRPANRTLGLKVCNAMRSAGT